MNDQLSSLLSQSWDKLAEAHTKVITVCNLSTNGVNAYSVVLREASADDGALLFYTDYRSPKVEQIKQDSRLTIHIYNEEDKLQLVLKGKAVIHYQNEIAQLYWKEDGYRGRRSYLAQPAPSTHINEPADGLAYLGNRQFKDTDTNGYENFAVIEVRIDELDYLKLNREGNRRAKFVLDNTGEWQGMWLVP
jgi:pyridoxamine 5'-phosphate oxidase